MLHSLKTHPIAAFFLLLLGLPILVLLGMGGINASGFCLEKGKWLSDEEQYRITLSGLIHLDHFPIETEAKGTQYYPHVKYESVDEYLRLHPDCCKVNKAGPYDLPPPTWLDTLFGYAEDVVVVNYVARYIDENGREHTQVRRVESLQGPCGQVKEY